MERRTFALLLVTTIASLLTAGAAWGIGFSLAESKEDLKLKYEVSVQDHGTGRVTIRFVLEDEGRLKPLSSIDLVVNSQETPEYRDLAIAMGGKTVDGKLHAAAHLKREWAERAEIQLKTSHLDGKVQPLTWFYHNIPVKDYMKEAEKK